MRVTSTRKAREHVPLGICSPGSRRDLALVFWFFFFFINALLLEPKVLPVGLPLLLALQPIIAAWTQASVLRSPNTHDRGRKPSFRRPTPCPLNCLSHSCTDSRGHSLLWQPSGRTRGGKGSPALILFRRRPTDMPRSLAISASS